MDRHERGKLGYAAGLGKLTPEQRSAYGRAAALARLKGRAPNNVVVTFALDAQLYERFRHHWQRDEFYRGKSRSEAVRQIIHLWCDMEDEWERWDDDERDPASPYYNPPRP